MDYLRSEVMVLEPDIICITESWMNDSLGEDEIKLDGYTLFRRDREVNCKGRGVLLYVRDILRPVHVEWKNAFPEQVWCKICLLYTSPSPRDGLLSRMPSSA